MYYLQPITQLHSFYSHHMSCLTQPQSRTPPSLNPKLQEYNDEPNLAQYFALEERIDEEQQLFRRKMSRLKSINLPKLLYLYQNILHNYQSYQAEIINPQQTHKECQVRINQNGQTAIKTITDTTKSCLATVQTIVFTKIDFETFKVMLVQSGHLQSVKKVQSAMIKRDEGLGKKDGGAVVEVLFRLFCLPTFDYILWPSLILQPVIGTCECIQNMINGPSKNLATSDTQRALFQESLNNFFSNVDQFSHRKDYFQPSPQHSVLLNNISLNARQEVIDQQFIVKLIGTNKTLIRRGTLVRWNRLQSRELQFAIAQTPFRLLVTELNKVINKLNAFKLQQHSPFNGKAHLFHLCKYQQQLCIPLRYAMCRPNNVLVRFLTNDRYRWVQQEQLSVNRTLPQHNREERKFYGILGQTFSNYQILSFIYSDYFYEHFPFVQALRIMYPLQELQRLSQKKHRCIVCYYLVRSQEQSVCCLYCGDKYHSQCANLALNIQYSPNIHQAQSQEDVWTCEQCRPCKICLTSIKEQLQLTCKNCKAIYHSECGKLIDVHGQKLQKTDFVCQKCLKCEFCLQKFSDGLFYVQNQKVLCSLCLTNSHKDFCLTCRQFIEQNEGIICTNDVCGQVLHKTCDALIVNNPGLDRGIFKCGSCRAGAKMKVLKWVLEELKIFDEYEYFEDPDYESIEGYGEIIKEPMCFLAMREKAVQGYYNEQTYEKLLRDVCLISNNAMTFNMPKEEVHYQAKILIIMASHFLSKLQPMLEFDQLGLLSHDLQQTFMGHRQAFYKDIFRNFTQYVLNYGKEETRIKVNGWRGGFQASEYVFSSRHLLVKGLIHSQMSYQYKLHPQQIDEMFRMPKVVPAVWAKVNQSLCYYHPKQKLPIVFQCGICWETYCCTQVCYKHFFCKICKKSGCYCVRRTCRCPSLSRSEYASLRRQALRVLAKTQMTLLEYTQYHKYCLKCAKELRRNCYLCNKICYFGYQSCNQCNVIYHIDCQKRHRVKEMASPSQGTHSDSLFRYIRLNRQCRDCCLKPQHAQRYKQWLKESIGQASRIRRQLYSYLQLFSYTYNQNGVRMTSNQIIGMLYQNYQGVRSKKYFIDQFLSIFKKKRQYPKVRALQTNIQVCSQIVLLLEQSKSLIIPQWDVHLPKEYLDRLGFQQRIKDICKIALGKDSHLAFHFALQTPNTNHLTLDLPWNYQPQYFYQMRCNILESHSRQKANALVDQKPLQEYKRYINLQNNNSNFYVELAEQLRLFNSQTAQLLTYLRFKNINPPNNEPLLSFPVFSPIYDLFEDKLVCPVRQELPVAPFPYPLTQRQDILFKYFTTFALGLFQGQKKVLRKGNTCILHSGENNWKICKKVSNSYIYVHLYKDQSAKWILIINDNRQQVTEISQICNALKEFGASVNNFDELFVFMGFPLMDSTHTYSDHYTNLLKRKDFHQMNNEQRRDEVLRIYEQFDWKSNGFFKHKATNKDYKVKVKKPFYLSKRHPVCSTEKKIQYKPFVTLQDIKKELFNVGLFQNGLEQEPNISNQPINDVYIAPSHIDRLGLFIGRSVPKYTTVIEYVGEIISEAMADLREKNTVGCYFFTLGAGIDSRAEIIDATHFGNKARYLNHSCDPNCKAQIKKVQGKNRILIYTIKDVQKYEELTYDYQFKIDSKEHLVCKCGSPLCQGRLT